MATVTLPYTLTAGTPENVNQLMANLTALTTGVNNIDSSNITDGSIGLADLSTAITDLLVPVGSVLDYGGTSDPIATKWILADGRAISRTTYSALFSALGTAFGVGDNATTFNIPDLRGRVSVGPDNMGTAQGAASRMADNNTRGANSGSSTVTLTTAQLPSHDHPFSVTVSGTTSTNGTHFHGITAATTWLGGYTNLDADDGGAAFSMGYGAFTSGDGAHNHTVTSTGSGTTSPTGSASAHDNRQPYQVLNKIIRIA